MIHSLSKSADSEALLKLLCQSSPNVFDIEVPFDLTPVSGHQMPVDADPLAEYESR